MPIIMIAVGREYFPDNQARLAGGKVLLPCDCGQSLPTCQPAQYAFWSRQTTANVLPMIIRSNMSDQLRM